MRKELCRNKHLRPTPSWRRIAACLFLYSTIWFVLTGTDYASWILGIPAVVLATTLNLSLSTPSKWTFSLSGTFRFAIFFLRQSFLSGFDVMRRALSPRLNINPGLILYTTFLPEGTARIFFINTISLLPGTLSADLQNNIVTVHTIDKNLPIWSNIQNLEARIAALMGVTSSQEKIP